MANEKLKAWVLEGIEELGGEATVIEVAKYIWHNHESDLWEGGDLFYKWQYEMRWAAQELRDEGFLALSGRKWVKP